MAILTQFVLRLSFGLALGMAITDPRRVTSGYYRNHAYVLLGLNVLATMVALTAPDRFPLWPPLAGAVTVTVTDFCVVPPVPVQLSVKVIVAVSAALVAVPLIACGPVQPPAAGPAVHEVAFWLDQTMSTVLPEDTVELSVLRFTTGAGGALATVSA